MNSRKNADTVERWTFRIVAFVLIAVPLLVFFFSFGNVGILGVSLGVERQIAFLTGPAVDLAVAGCVIASSYLSARGWTERRLWPLHVAALVLGLFMVALNTGGALYTHRWRLAAFDCVGPVLLIGWGSLAPWLWRNLTEARQQGGIGAAAANRDAPRQRTLTAAPAAEPASGSGAAAKAALGPAAGGSEPAPLPVPDAAPVPPGSGSEGGNVVSISGTGRRSPADWAVLALPLWRRHVEATNATPTAPELAALLRHAHPELPVPRSDRSERNIRAATEDLADAETEPEREKVG